MSDTDLTKIETTILSLFKEKTAAKYIKHRPGAGGMSFPYVEVGYVINKLNAAFGIFWEWKIIDKGIGKKQIWVQGDLTIKFPNGYSVTKSGFGGAQIKCFRGTEDPVDISNDLKGASSAALKKAASLYGIAADVYYKEQDKYDTLADEIPAPTPKEMAEQKRKSTMSRFFAVASERGFEAEEAKEQVKEYYRAAHMSDLDTYQLEAAIKGLEAKYKKVPDGARPQKIGEEQEVIDLEALPSTL